MLRRRLHVEPATDLDQLSVHVYPGAVGLGAVDVDSPGALDVQARIATAGVGYRYDGSAGCPRRRREMLARARGVKC